MLRILIVGCGDVGLRLARRLRGRARFLGLLRTPERAAELRAAGVMPIHADLDDRRSLRRLAGLADIVMHFAPPPGEGVTDPRTARMLAALNHSSLPRALVYVSTSGVYGDCAGARVEETRPARPNNARAKRRLDAETRLRAWAATRRARLSHPARAGYLRGRPHARGAGAQGLPALSADEDIYTNHIHADDLALLAWTAAFRGRPEPGLQRRRR
jgi:nucleoside-diphosphate-sugar epimerase